MSETNTSLKNDIDALVNKTIEANKMFINEGSSILKQITSNKGSPSTINIFKNDFLSKALNAYASLNIQHAKNLIDLGISLTKSLSQKNDTDFENESATPSFILNSTCKAGEAILLSFAIDNNKKEEVNCQFINSNYILQSDFSNSQNFDTIFTPQSFIMKPGSSQTVQIKIDIPKNATVGLYISNVQVKGFEPAFFSIHLAIS